MGDLISSMTFSVPERSNILPLTRQWPSTGGWTSGTSFARMGLPSRLDILRWVTKWDGCCF